MHISTYLRRQAAWGGGGGAWAKAGAQPCGGQGTPPAGRMSRQQRADAAARHSPLLHDVITQHAAALIHVAGFLRGGHPGGGGGRLRTPVPAPTPPCLAGQSAQARKRCLPEAASLAWPRCASPLGLPSPLRLSPFLPRDPCGSAAGCARWCGIPPSSPVWRGTSCTLQACSHATARCPYPGLPLGWWCRRALRAGAPGRPCGIGWSPHERALSQCAHDPLLAPASSRWRGLEAAASTWARGAAAGVAMKDVRAELWWSAGTSEGGEFCRRPAPAPPPHVAGPCTSYRGRALPLPAAKKRSRQPVQQMEGGLLAGCPLGGH